MYLTETVFPPAIFVCADFPRGTGEARGATGTARRVSADYLPTLAFMCVISYAQNYICQKHHGTLHPHDRLADTYTLSRYLETHTTVLSVERPQR